MIMFWMYCSVNDQTPALTSKTPTQENFLTVLLKPNGVLLSTLRAALNVRTEITFDHKFTGVPI